MKEMVNIVRDILLLLSRLLWLSVQTLARWTGEALRYLYRHRVPITGHRLTPYVVLLLCTVWFIFSMKNRSEIASLPEKAPGEAVHYRPQSLAQDSVWVAEYQAMTGSLPAEDTDLRLIHSIHNWLGTPHCDGGHTLSGIDCSGFVQSVFQETYRIQLSRNSAEMYEEDVNVIDRDELKEGDLVFFRIGGSGISHVGIFLKDDLFVHTSNSKGVTVDSMNSPYYRKAYYRAGRVKKVPMWAFKG
jgi:hypothetical protein